MSESPEYPRAPQSRRGELLWRIAAAVEGLRDPDFDRCARAYDELEDLLPESACAVPLLKEMLKIENGHGCFKALEFLCYFGSDCADTVPALIEILKDGNPHVLKQGLAEWRKLPESRRERRGKSTST